jgi:hypothetical protein
MGKNKANSKGVENRTAVGPRLLRRFDVVSFSRKFGIESNRSVFLIWFRDSTSAIEVYSEIIRAGKSLIDSGATTHREIGEALLSIADSMRLQCVSGDTGILDPNTKKESTHE